MTEPLFSQDAYLRRCEARIIAVDDGGIRLDRTVFYPMAGGQPGDTGTLRLEDGGTIVITDTRKGQGDAILHIPSTDSPTPRLGARVEAEIDWDRRYRHMQMHTSSQNLNHSYSQSCSYG